MIQIMFIGNKNNQSNEAEMNRQKKENQALLQLVLIVFAYFFGYLPHNGKIFEYLD